MRVGVRYANLNETSVRLQNCERLDEWLEKTLVGHHCLFLPYGKASKNTIEYS